MDSVSEDTTAPNSEAVASFLSQTWAAAEASRGEASAPPLVDIRQFKAEWMRVLTPPSPRIDVLDQLFVQHRLPREAEDEADDDAGDDEEEEEADNEGSDDSEDSDAGKAGGGRGGKRRRRAAVKMTDDDIMRAINEGDGAIDESLVPPPDLSCDDIFVGTSRQQIQAAIEREMVRTSPFPKEKGASLFSPFS